LRDFVSDEEEVDSLEHWRRKRRRQLKNYVRVKKNKRKKINSNEDNEKEDHLPKC
jgi:hypothetical protein